jgi:hypothetical protein
MCGSSLKNRYDLHMLQMYGHALSIIKISIERIKKNC